jgi:hypothetical protein
MGIWADFWLGKQKTEIVDLMPATATVEMEDGRTYTISRKGSVWHSGFVGPIACSGLSSLKGYLTSGKAILEADSGDMFPSCKIKNITITVSHESQSIEWR